MKKLGKKRCESIETVEAYDIWGCANHVTCDCEGEGYSFQGLNNALYKYMRNDLWS